jgi:hypothetical protein
MGLDVYVGSLTRYYAHDWETVIQRAGREQGIPVVVQRRNESPDTINDPAVLRDLILRWRSAIGDALRSAGLSDQELDWSEDPHAPYLTDKPGWDCYGAVQLLAAYDERGKSPVPTKLPSDWQKDSFLRDRLRAPSKPRYAHLYACALWLPVEIRDIFAGPSPAAEQVRMGSVFELFRNLQALNERTFNGSDEDRKQWAAQMPDTGDDRLEPKAKTGIAIMLQLAAAAARERLPMVLDY